MEVVMDIIKKQLLDYNFSEEAAMYTSYAIIILAIFILCVVANFIAKKLILKVVIHIVKHNKYTWDDILVEKRVFHRLSHIVPAIIIYFFASIFTSYEAIIQKLALTYIFIIAIAVINSVLNAIDEIYRTFPVSKIRPIKGYITVVKIVLYIFGAILIISNLIGQNPVYILSGLGALSAVTMLIFKDSILGLVAGVQLSSNDMVRVGDWIEMPKYNANGDIIDITLNTVKVLNFDKTITFIPSYAFVADSFINWRGMQNAGGRRIKRSIYIDTSSIRFCNDEMIDSFKKIHYITDYITTRVEEIKQYNTEHKIDTSNKVNGRQLTNIGVFRIYIEQYLRRHKGIHQEHSLMVRQLAPGDSGLPLEIYAFTNDIVWANYEAIQSDIFDHIFAVAPQFGLRIFQNPTGHDLVQTVERGQQQRQIEFTD